MDTGKHRNRSGSSTLPRGILIAGALGLAWAFSAAPVLAATESVEKVVRATGKPGKLEAVSMHVTSTVENIDYKTRKVTLKSSNGSLLTVVAGPEIQRLDEVKKGDLLEVEYLESIAVSVHKPDEKTEPGDSAYSVLVRNPSQSPSGKKIETETITATVDMIDAQKRVAELVDADGNRVRVAIAPEVQRLDQVKKGDIVVVKYTRTVALSVHKPEPKQAPPGG